MKGTRIDQATRAELRKIADDLAGAVELAKKKADEHADECGLKGDHRETFVTSYVTGALAAQTAISACHLRSLLGVPS